MKSPDICLALPGGSGCACRLIFYTKMVGDELEGTLVTVWTGHKKHPGNVSARKEKSNISCEKIQTMFWYQRRRGLCPVAKLTRNGMARRLLSTGIDGSIA